MKQIAVSLSIATVTVGFMLTGCGSLMSIKGSKLQDDAAFASPEQLTARLADPINIDLKWKDRATREAGYLVEYSPHANQEYAVIDALPPNSTGYRHPNLMPHTKFVFRVRPYFGMASKVETVITGKQGPQQNPPVFPERKSRPEYSVRSMSNAQAAAPSHLKATLIPPAGIRLDWDDHAQDADEYLIEMKAGNASEFRPSVFLPAGSTAWVGYGFPFEAKMFFRVRAIFYGKPSNLASQTTGADPGGRR